MKARKLPKDYLPKQYGISWSVKLDDAFWDRFYARYPVFFSDHRKTEEYKERKRLGIT